jgi:hypothetical protein
MLKALMHSLSSLEFALLMAAIFIIAGQLLLFLIQKYIKKKYLIGWGNVDSEFLAAITGIFSLILAFVTISVWQSHSDINNIVSKEANAIYNIYRTIDAYPPIERDQAKEKLRDYVKEVIHSEWPAMANGAPDTKTIEKAKAFHDLVIHFSPKNNQELAAHQEVLRLMSEYRELRRNRVMTIEPLIGGLLWFVLLSTLSVFYIALCFLEIKGYQIHALQVALLSVAISATFSLLVLYDYPFLGPQGISVDPFKSVLEVYMTS